MLVCEWDEPKRRANLAQHQVDFQEIGQFDWDTARYLYDTRRDCGEGRIQGYGLIDDRVHIVVFTIRNTGVRIISLRKGNRREIARYVEATS